MSYEHIKILITPLEYEGIYGSVIDVTEDIDVTALVKDNIGSIRRDIDNGDFDIGVFVFGSITLRCYNDEGKFSPPQDYRSIFKYSRDLARVKIIFIDKQNAQSVLFEGIINEDTSRDEDLPDDDVKTGTIKFRVLSLDSIFRHAKVAGGAIATGISLSTAIKQILNTTQITNVLNYVPAKINVDVDVDIDIDDGDYFSGKSVKDALDDLLLAANSFLLIDDNKDIVVTPRIENSNLFNLYAPHDPLGRGNIIQIKDYNSGLQRCFSAVKVNNTEVSDEASIGDYGYRLKSLSLDFITSPASEEIIAQKILEEFKALRLECVLKVPFSDVPNIERLDTVTVDYPLRISPPRGEEFVTTVDTLIVGQSKHNNVNGAIEISPKIQWKVIAIKTNIKDFTIEAKLRQVGKVYGEGVV